MKKGIVWSEAPTCSGVVTFGGSTARRFDGVIGGPPCQMFSRLSHMVRHNGHEPKFGNLIPEFERCVREAEPQWFVMEEVPDAPLPALDGYGVHSFLLNNRQLGESQNRVRRWSFGLRGHRRVLEVETQLFENPRYEYAVVAGGRRCPVAIGGSGKRKTIKDDGGLPWNSKSKRAFDKACRLQGLPDDFDLPPFTIAAKCQAVGNGVPMAMGRAIAKAVKEAIAR